MRQLTVDLFMALSAGRICKQQQQHQHVVAVPLPAQGHLNPLMRFCKLLASQGVLVTFVNIDPVHHRLEELALQDVEEEEGACSGQNGDPVENHIRSTHIPIQGLNLADGFRVSLECFFEAQNSIAAPLEALIQELNRQGPPVTCLVSDFFMTLPTQNVADKLNIPRVVFCPASASFLLLTYYLTQGEGIFTTRVLEALARRTESREVICKGLIGLPTINNNEVPHYKHVVDDTLCMWGLKAKACQESFCRAHAMAINTFEDLEAPALMALSKHVSLPIYAVGPLLAPLHKESSTSLWKEDEACILWLDQQPPLTVLYISFGSVTLLSQPQFEEFRAGLLSSQQRFLWVFRPDLVDNSEYSSNFVSDVLSRSQGKGYIIDWAPQLEVLSHTSVGGFLTHCGWNSTMEAIAHGVPMLCWPYFADQIRNAKYVVEEWKVGLQFDASKEGTGLVQRHEVESVINALMEGEKGRLLKKNAMSLQEAGSLDTSHNNIQSLMKSFM